MVSKKRVNGIFAKISTKLYIFSCPVDLIKLTRGVTSADSRQAISSSGPRSVGGVGAGQRVNCTYLKFLLAPEELAGD